MQKKYTLSFLAFILALAFTMTQAFAAETPAVAPSLESADAVATDEPAEEAVDIEAQAEATSTEASTPMSTDAGDDLVPSAGGSCVPGGGCWSHNDCGGIPTGWCYKFSHTCWCS